MFEMENEISRKLLKAVQEFTHYIGGNQDFIPNYGERYRFGETITTAIVESTVNWVKGKKSKEKRRLFGLFGSVVG